jgi:hypothetical protein
MRRLALLFPLCLSCGDSGPDVSGVNQPAERIHSVSGMVEDSVLSLNLAGVRLRIGDSLVVSDSRGWFEVKHRAGNFGISVQDVAYERYDAPLALFQDRQSLVVRLQGQAPYLVSCDFEADLLTARILDLQGRKTINRRSQSTITLLANQTSVKRDAYSWYFTPVDNLTWLAHVPLQGVVADTAVWRLEDSDGYVRTTQCVKQPAPCTTC